jgi:plastocyanin
MTTLVIRRGLWTFGIAIGIAALALVWLQGARASGEVAQTSGTKTVDINHFAFHPPTLTVTRGTRVAFVNSSKITHTATHRGFFNHRIKPGTTAFVRFGQKGTFTYHCTIHPFMRGKIVVE